MMHRSTRPRALPYPILLTGLLPIAAFLAGCLGGDLDSSTVAPVTKDTLIVYRPPKDTTPVRDTVPSAAVHSIYPRLKIGEKWSYSQFSGTDTGTVYSLEAVGEATYGNDSVYVERLSVTAPPFAIDDFGSMAVNFLETGLIYARISDQETVHDSLTESMDLVSAGDTIGTHYRQTAVTTTRYTGTLPDSLKEGAAWSLAEVRSRVIQWAYPDTSGIDSSNDTRTRTYVVKAPVQVSLKAGTFSAFEIDEADSGSASTTRVWFSPAAKGIVREIDANPTYADTSELSDLLLK
jgi:hypothetical protein